MKNLRSTMRDIRLYRCLIPILCLGFAGLSATPVKAQFSANPITSGEKAAVFAGIGAAAGIIAVTVYLLVRKPSITGCTETSGSGLVLRTDGDGTTYALTGDVAQLKAGERVRLSGKRSKDFGACQAASPSR